MFNFKRNILFTIFLLTTTRIWAGPQYINYEGYIETTSGTPVSSSVIFLFQIKSPSPSNCVLYEETQNIMPTNGRFTAKVGAGAKTYPGTAVPDMSVIYANTTTLTGQSSCTYTPSADDSRNLVVMVNDGGYVLVANISLGTTMNSFNAERLEGKKSAEFLQVSAAAVQTALTAAQVTALYNLIAGTSTSYLQPGQATTVSGAVTFTTTPQITSTPSAGNDATNVTYVTNAITTATPNVGTTGTYYKVTTDSKGRVSAGVTTLAAADITSGTFLTGGMVSGTAITSGNISTTGSYNSSSNMTLSNASASLSASTGSLSLYSATNLPINLSASGTGIVNVTGPAGLKLTSGPITSTTGVIQGATAGNGLTLQDSTTANATIKITLAGIKIGSNANILPVRESGQCYLTSANMVGSSTTVILLPTGISIYNILDCAGIPYTATAHCVPSTAPSNASCIWSTYLAGLNKIQINIVANNAICWSTAPNWTCDVSW